MNEVQLNRDKVILTSPSAIAAVMAFDAPVLKPSEAADLLQAVKDVDLLLLDIESNYDFTKIQFIKRDELYKRYADYRRLLLEHRRRLENLYQSLTGESPWEDVPF